MSLCGIAPGGEPTAPGRESLPGLPLPAAGDEAVSILQSLVRFDTSNPPGNETACAQWVAEALTREGVPATVIEPSPGRGSVIARLAGTGDARPILLLSHLDVSPAVAEDWRHDPFGGELIEGEIWGRGTLDTKNLTAVWMEILFAIKRLGLVPRRDLIFAATADEETGGLWGVNWIVRNQPRLLDAEYVINEGGGLGTVLDGVTVSEYQTAEKGICRLRMTARGRAGHASVPHADNPVVRLAAALHTLGTSLLPVHVTDILRLYVEGRAAGLSDELAGALRLALDAEAAEAGLARIPDEHLADLIRAMSRNTACPTVVRAGVEANVIPRTATAEIDGRFLPGQTPATLLDEIRAVLGLTGGPEDKIDLEVARSSPPTASPPTSDLSRAFVKALAKHYPGAGLVPVLSPGGTDSRFLRARGAVCYGFCPVLPDIDDQSVHGVDERIPVASLEFALKVLWDVVLEMAF